MKGQNRPGILLSSYKILVKSVKFAAWYFANAQKKSIMEGLQ